MIIVFGIQMVMQGLIDIVEDEAPFLGLLLFIAAWLIESLFVIGFIKISLLFAEGTKGRLNDLYAHAHLLGKYIVAAILYGLMVAVGIVLLIIPGIILAIMFGFYGYFIVEQGMGPLEALKASARLTAGQRWNLFGFSLVIIVINILGALFFGIGLLLTVPVTIMARAYVYRRLRGLGVFSAPAPV